MEEDAEVAKRREGELKKRIRNPEGWQERENALSWVRGADEIMEATGGGWPTLSQEEHQFVRRVRRQMERYANPRVKKKWWISDRQRAWFAAIYRRYVLKGRKVA
jgi:hypothetical protein